MFAIRVVSDLEEAHRLWELLSPKMNLYEDWDFRYLFYKYFNYPLRFLAGEEDGKVLGLMPLQLNLESGKLEFFAGSFMEDNHVFILPGQEKHIPDFYQAIREPAQLEDIVRDGERVRMEFMEYKYIIDLRGLTSLEGYLERTFSAKTRAKLRKKIKEVEGWGVGVEENRYGDIDRLMELNRKNFGADSSFNKPHRQEIYHDLVENGFQVVMLSADIAGKTEGVSLAIKYGEDFVSFNAGVNKTDYEDLGNYLLLRRIEKAIRLGCTTYDAGIADLGWKERWHLTKVPQYQFSSGLD